VNPAQKDQPEPGNPRKKGLSSKVNVSGGTVTKSKSRKERRSVDVGARPTFHRRRDPLPRNVLKRRFCKKEREEKIAFHKNRIIMATLTQGWFKNGGVTDGLTEGSQGKKDCLRSVLILRGCLSG